MADPARRALQFAAARLPARQRDILETVVVMYDGRMAAALQRADLLVQRYPQDGDALYTAGEVAFHSGLSPAMRGRALGLFERALAADSSLPEPYLHLIEELADRGDTVRAWSALARGVAHAPAYPKFQSHRLAMDVVLRHRPADALADSLFAAPGEPWRRLYAAADEDLPRLRASHPTQAIAASAAIYRAMSLSGRPAFSRLVAFLESAVLAQARGRINEAWRDLDSAVGIMPGHTAPDIFSVLIAAPTGGQLERARLALTRLDAVPDSIFARREYLWLRGRWAFAAGDSGALAAAARELRTPALAASAMNQAMAEGFDGWHALLRGDSAQARDRLRTALATRTYGWDATAPERHMGLTLSRLELAAGDLDAALRALDITYYGRDGVGYCAEAEELRGAIARARGDTAETRRALTTFVELWADADAPLQPRVARARATLAPLDSGR